MDYEEYMRNVLGYQPIKYDNTYNMNYNMINNDSKPIFNNYQVQELENCYPDIYRIIYPMIQKVCSQNIGNITKEVIDRMTDEVYFAVEDREMLENREKKQDTTVEKSTDQAKAKKEKARKKRLAKLKAEKAKKYLKNFWVFVDNNDNKEMEAYSCRKFNRSSARWTSGKSCLTGSTGHLPRLSCTMFPSATTRPSAG